MISKGRSRLGRGLSSLMSISAELPPPVGDPSITPATVDPAPAEEVTGGRGAVTEVPVATILPNPNQPRHRFDPTQLTQLAESIKGSGLIQPIVVRRAGEGYELIAGERRLRAVKLAGLATIPVIIREADPLTQAQWALVENIQREDLNPIDRAAAYRLLIDRLGLTQAELAARLGEERSGIANYLRILELAKPVQEFLREGKLSLGHAKLLAGVDDLLEQERLSSLVVSQELSVRNLEKLIQDPARAPAARRVPPAEAYIADLEKNASQQLGMRVQVRRSGKGKGRLMIHYGSLDQFDQLMSRLGIKIE